MYILDSSIWVSLFLEQDINHNEAKTIFASLKSVIFVSYSVIGEVATVLTYKHSKKQGDLFLEFIEGNRDIIIINNDWRADVTRYKAIREKISFADVSIVMFAISNNLALVTFDEQMKKLHKKLTGSVAHKTR